MDEKNLEKAEVDFRAAMAKIDKAGVRRVLHPNTAARRKSKLARTYAAALAKAKQAELSRQPWRNGRTDPRAESPVRFLTEPNRDAIPC